MIQFNCPSRARLACALWRLARPKAAGVTLAALGFGGLGVIGRLEQLDYWDGED